MTFLDVNSDSVNLKKERSTSAIGKGVRKNNKPKTQTQTDRGNLTDEQDTQRQFDNE